MLYQIIIIIFYTTCGSSSFDCPVGPTSTPCCTECLAGGRLAGLLLRRRRAPPRAPCMPLCADCMRRHACSRALPSTASSHGSPRGIGRRRNSSCQLPLATRRAGLFDGHRAHDREVSRSHLSVIFPRFMDATVVGSGPTSDRLLDYCWVFNLMIHFV